MRFVDDLPSPRVVFGDGALARVPEEADSLAATRILLVASASAARRAAELRTQLTDIVVDQVEGVEQHVPVERAVLARERASECRADLLLTIGGGSAVGLAKAIALTDSVPILAIPTTYSGSEMTPIWGITTNGRKQTGRARGVVPRTVVYDPLLTTALPAGLTATSGLNAVAHCVEALYSPSATPMTAAIAAEAIKLLGEGLPTAVASPADQQAREQCLLGAHLAGVALARTKMGIHHRLCHALGGLAGVDHAGVHAVLLPHIAAFNSAAAPAAMARVAQALGTEDAVGGLFELARTVGAPTRLDELGVPESALAQVADEAGHPAIELPRPVGRPEALEILKSAWR